MMVGRIRVGVAVLAALALGAVPAVAKPAGCVTKPQIATLTRVLLPGVVAATLARCVPLLPADAYLVRAAPKLRAEFAGRPGVDPAETRRAIEAISGETLPKGADNAALETVFATAIVGEFGLDKLSAQSCRNVSEIVEPLDALPREAMEHLIVAVTSVVARKDDKIRLCPVAAD